MMATSKGAAHGNPSSRFLRACLLGPLALALAASIAGRDAEAAFVAYVGDTTQEALWRAAAGTTALETFESHAVGAQIASLPALGVGFAPLAGGGLPVIYQHHEDITPHGTKHLANFPLGIGGPNAGNDIVLQVLAGFELTALGFWNGDGQPDTLVANVYDASSNLIGSIGAFKGVFAGFVTDQIVARVVFVGATGDGWNHFDGLQTNARRSATPVPEPGTGALAGLALVALLLARAKSLS